MWMVDPKIMCRQHLLGEHVECHMCLSILRSDKSIDGYIKNNCIEPQSVKSRHDALAEEMLKRGYNHKSKMNLTRHESKAFPDVIIDRKRAKERLLNRCEKCKQNHDNLSCFF